MPDTAFELMVCAAPSGDRRLSNSNPIQDFKSVNNLISVIQKTKINRMVLISSIDTINYPNTAYGRHRLSLELAVNAHVEHCHILRCSSLIGKNIKKNVLYDLKHRQYIDSINPDTQLQWCNLDKLHTNIQSSIYNNVQEINLVSHPIKNQQIVDRFFPTIILTSQQQTQFYDLHPYLFSVEEIFDNISNYLQ
jgi:hypothetical protein